MKLPNLKQIMKVVRIVNAITTGIIIVHDVVDNDKKDNNE